MGDELGGPGLVDEQPAGRQHTGDLNDGLLGAGDVEEGAEVHDQVEAGVGEGQSTRVAADQLDRSAAVPRGLGLDQ